MQPLLTLCDIEKRFGDRIALALDYLTIASGRLYLLTGHNGSGKSTLLQLMAFLESPEQGQLLLDGQPVSRLGKAAHQARQQVTLLHQNPYLIKGTVFDNVAYGLRLRGEHGPILLQRVKQALEQVQLSGFDQRDARRLSGGESRRVALARAVACAPRLLLLDEPLANLDQEHALLMEQVVAALPGQGTTVVMSSHEAGQAERLGADRIVLEQGRLVAPRQARPEGSSCEWRGAVVCPGLVASEA